MRVLLRWLALPEAQAATAGRLLALVFTSSVALAFAKSAQTGIFLHAWPKTAIPWAFMGSAFALAVVSAGLVSLAARLGPLRLAWISVATSMAVLGGLAVALLWPLAWLEFAQYVVIETMAGVLVVQVWTVVSLATDARSARSLLPLAGVGSAVAWVLGGLAVPPLVRVGGSEVLLVLAAVALGWTLWLIRRVARRDVESRRMRGKRTSNLLASWRAGLGYVARSPLLRIVVVLSVLAMVGEQLLDTLLMAAAQETCTTQEEISAFFGVFYSVTSAISVVMLLGLAGRIVSMLGPRGSLLAPPALVLGLGLAAFGAPSMAIVVLLRGAYRVLKRSVWSTGLEQLQTVSAPVQRAQSRALIRGVLAPGGYGLGALGLALLPALEVRWLALGVALVMGAMIVAAIGVRRSYVSALRSSIDGRHLVLDDETRLDPTALDAGSVAALLAELEVDDPQRAGLAAEVLAASREPTWVARGLVHPLAAVRVAALRVAGDEDVEAVARILASDPVVDARRAAARALAGRTPAPVVREALAAGREDVDPEVAARSAAGLAVIDGGVTGLLDVGSAPARAVVLRGLPTGAVGAHAEVILSALDDPAVEVRRAAVLACARGRLDAVVPQLGAWLGEPAFGRHLAPEVVRWAPSLDLTSLSPLAASNLARALAEAGDARSHAWLIGLMGHPSRAVRDAVARAAVRAVRLGRCPPLQLRAAPAVIAREVAAAWRASCLLAGIARDDGVADWTVEPEFVFLADEIERSARATRRRVVFLLYATGCVGLEAALDLARSREARVEPQIAELIELEVPREVARGVVPLFERRNLRERVDLARRLGLADEQALRDPLAALVGHSDGHLVGCAMLCYGDRFVARHPERAEEVAAVISTLERMRFLRSVPLFHELAGDDLREIALVVTERSYPAGHVVIRKGDPGAELFLIVKGRVVIRDGGVELATFGEREFFGELSVLDGEPRSADGVCLEPVRLLELRGVDLEELIAKRPPIGEAILVELVRRLRQTGKRVTA